MNLSLIRSMTRSAVFELENGKCFRPEHPFAVALNGKTIYESCNTNVFSLFSLTPSTTYTVEVDTEGEHLKLDFTTEAESFFVDASRYGLVADGETDNTGRLQAALSTCPRGGTVYVPAGRYRTASLFMKSCTTLYLEKGAVLLGDNDRTHYPILPGVIPSENEVDEYYLTGWEGNPLNSFAGLLNITQVHDVVVTGEGTLDCDAQNGDWWVDPKVKRIAWRPRAVAMVDSENVCLHGITVQNSYSWTIHPIFVKHLDLLNFNINNPYNAPNTDGIDPESCEYTRIIGVNNRNLKTFEVDVENSRRLRALAPLDAIFVSESGIRTAEDVRALYENGTDAVLIGETLMRAKDKDAMLNELTRLLPKNPREEKNHE